MFPNLKELIAALQNVTAAIIENTAVQRALHRQMGRLNELLERQRERDDA